MRFTTMGKLGNPVILFFHAMGVNGESSTAVAAELKDQYFIVMPTLSAYCQGEVLVSREDEILQLKNWLQRQDIDRIELLVASSLGADFAMAFLTSSGIPVRRAFFDGGQFAQIGKMTRRIMVPFLYLAIKSLYWSKGKTLGKILWCDDERIRPYFIDAGKGLDHASLRHMMRDCLTEEPFPAVDEQLQRNMVLEFGSLEDHFKYRDAVMRAYPQACFPVFRDMNHMQLQIRHPKEFAVLLRQMIEGGKLPLETGEYTGEELTALISEREDRECIR